MTYVRLELSRAAVNSNTKEVCLKRYNWITVIQTWRFLKAWNCLKDLAVNSWCDRALKTRSGQFLDESWNSRGAVSWSPWSVATTGTLTGQRFRPLFCISWHKFYAGLEFCRYNITTGDYDRDNTTSTNNNRGRNGGYGPDLWSRFGNLFLGFVSLTHFEGNLRTVVIFPLKHCNHLQCSDPWRSRKRSTSRSRVFRQHCHFIEVNTTHNSIHAAHTSKAWPKNRFENWLVRNLRSSEIDGTACTQSATLVVILQVAVHGLHANDKWSSFVMRCSFICMSAVALILWSEVHAIFQISLSLPPSRKRVCEDFKESDQINYLQNFIGVGARVTILVCPIKFFGISCHGVVRLTLLREEKRSPMTQFCHSRNSIRVWWVQLLANRVTRGRNMSLTQNRVKLSVTHRFAKTKPFT